MAFFFLTLLLTIQGEQVQKGLPLSRIMPPDTGTYEDFLSLERTLDGVRIIGLGEANYGTSEFIRHKSRLVRFLVETQGFRVLLLESGYFNCHSLNAYVQGEKVSLAEALHHQQYPVWETHGMAKLCQWMRKFNHQRAPEDRLLISGFDIRDNGNARDTLSDFLQKKSPSYHLQVTGALQKVALTGEEDPRTAMYGSSTLQEIEKHLEGISHKISGLDSTKDFKKAWRALQVLKQASAYATAKNERVARNVQSYFMTENIKAIAEDAPDQKMIIWAHNRHVRFGGAGPRQTGNLGTHLRRWLDRGYFALGLSFGEGTFRAFARGAKDQDFQIFATGKPFPSSLGHYLAGFTDTASLLVLRGLQQLEPGLLEPLTIRWAGKLAGPRIQKHWQQHPRKVVLAKQFDAIIHIPTIHAAMDINAICPR